MRGAVAHGITDFHIYTCNKCIIHIHIYLLYVLKLTEVNSTSKISLTERT